MPSLLIALLCPDYQYWKYNLQYSIHYRSTYRTNLRIQMMQYTKPNTYVNIIHTETHSFMRNIYCYVKSFVCVVKITFRGKHLNFLDVTWQLPHILIHMYLSGVMYV